ncbi:hypothetical protein DL96DRAFT_862008 [Flagelloscypha sp. PMI_526]|nr:hypothetical protein DL96DRAFT_862008 [Flagelloscypha sp. PMI_526]
MSTQTQRILIPEILRLICQATDERTGDFSRWERRSPTLARLARVSRAWFEPAVETLFGNGWGVCLMTLVEKCLPHSQLDLIHHRWRTRTDNFGVTYLADFTRLGKAPRCTQEDWDRFRVYARLVTCVCLNMKFLHEDMGYQLMNLAERFGDHVVFPRLQHIRCLFADDSREVALFLNCPTFLPIALKTIQFRLCWDGEDEMQFVFSTASTDVKSMAAGLESKLRQKADPHDRLFGLGDIPGLAHLELVWRKNSRLPSLSKRKTNSMNFQSLTILKYRGNHPTFPRLLEELQNAPLREIELDFEAAADLVSPTFAALSKNEHVSSTLQVFDLGVFNTQSTRWPESPFAQLLSFSALRIVMVRDSELIVTNEILFQMARVWSHLEELSLYGPPSLEPRLKLDGIYSILSDCHRLRRFSCQYHPDTESETWEDIYDGLCTMFPHIYVNLSEPWMLSSPQLK